MNWRICSPGQEVQPHSTAPTAVCLMPDDISTMSGAS